MVELHRLNGLSTPKFIEKLFRACKMNYLRENQYLEIFTMSNPEKTSAFRKGLWNERLRVGRMRVGGIVA